MAPSATASTTITPKRPIIIGNVAGAMEDCPYAMLEPRWHSIESFGLILR